MEDNKKKEVVFAASALAKVERDHKIFEGDNNQTLRLIREMTVETSKQPKDIPSKLALQIACGLRDEFKNSLVRNNRAVSKYKSEKAKLFKLDPTAYAKEIADNLEQAASIDKRSKNIRVQLSEMESLIDQISSGRFTVRGESLLTKISNAYRLRSAMKNIFKNKELFNWLITKPIKTLDEFKDFLAKGNINEMENMMKDFAKTVRMDMESFRSQVVLLKPYMKKYNPELLILTEEFEQDDLTDLNKGVEFIREFKQYYLKVNTIEEFLKIEGITDTLTSSMDMVLGIHTMLGKLLPGSSYDEESVKAIQEMMDVTISENGLIVQTSFALARSFTHKILGIKLEESNDEEIWRAITLVLCSIFHLLDIRSGASTLTILSKMD